MPIHPPIKKLSISPSGHFLAILTENTIHIASLPDISRLGNSDQTAIKLKTFQLGPTTHVLPQSPIVRALWHPFANATLSTDCVVTITAEAAVRVWELDKSNHWSFDRPALALDLKKLIDGTSCEDDFEPSAFGKTRGFSADVFDMEVTAACFGGQGAEGEDGWASMTLWTAMGNGDVYALCPLLPSMWVPAATTIPSLSTSVTSSLAALSDETVSDDEKEFFQQQYSWLQQIDEASADPDLLTRPELPSSIPRLQGPFDADFDDGEDESEISDIRVVAAQLDWEQLVDADEEAFADIAASSEEYLPATIIYLATTSGKVHILVDVDGVSGRWVPKVQPRKISLPDDEFNELMLVETVQTAAEDDLTLTIDASNPFNCYVTSPKTVSYISLDRWTSRLAAVLGQDDEESNGLEKRLKAACSADPAESQVIYNVMNDGSAASHTSLGALVIVTDPQLGQFILTTTSNKAFAVFFAIPSEMAQTPDHKFDPKLSIMPPPPIPRVEASRPTYSVPDALYHSPIGRLQKYLRGDVSERERITLKQPMRLSAATLEVVTTVHQHVSSRTAIIEKIAAELFLRVERLREELAEQVKIMTDYSNRIQRNDEEDENGEKPKKPQERLDAAKERQGELQKRYESLRKKAAQSTPRGRELSSRELAWQSEIERLDHRVGSQGDDTDQTVAARYDSIKTLTADLLRQAKSASNEKEASPAVGSPRLNGRRTTDSNASQTSHVPSRMQRLRMAEAMTMVEREAAVIEAAMTKLSKLNIES